MFSVTYTGMCCLPLCTAMVRPTKSGRTVERRDQVLIGRLSFAAEAASTFFMRCPSTNGPFLIERAIASPLRLLVAAAHDHRLRALVGAGLLAFRRLFPRRHRVAVAARAAVNVHAAVLAAPHAQLRVLAFTREQLHAGARGARDLRALAGKHLDAVHRRADRDVAKRQRVAGLDRRLGAALDALADREALG